MNRSCPCSRMACRNASRRASTETPRKPVPPFGVILSIQPAEPAKASNYRKWRHAAIATVHIEAALRPDPLGAEPFLKKRASWMGNAGQGRGYLLDEPLCRGTHNAPGVVPYRARGELEPDVDCGVPLQRLPRPVHPTTIVVPVVVRRAGHEVRRSRGTVFAYAAPRSA